MKGREIVLAALLVALLVFAAAVEPGFVTLKTQSLLSTHLWELAIVAVPMLFVIITGGIDLSVGANVALSAVVLGLLYEKGVPIWAAASIAIVTGKLMGVANGLFVAKLRVHPLIVTLATMAAFRGIAEGISLARPLSGYPDSFLAFTKSAPILFAAIAIIAWLILARTKYGRWLYAIGQNEKAARFSAIPVAKVKLWVYAATGVCCGIAATLMVARNNTAKADLATGMELEAITAVVLGGASIQGGTGTVTGLVLGLALVHETREFVSWHWGKSEIGLIVVGGLLLVSVLAQKLLERNRVVSRGT